VSDPRAVLARIPGFAAGRVESRLASGVTGESFHVTRNGESYVLRIDTPEAARLGLDREAERAVYGTLAASGLAPDLVHADPVGGILLRPFVPGRAWTPADLQRPENLQRLAVVLRRLHSLPPAGWAFDPLAAARRYADQVGTARADDLFERVAEAFGALEPDTPALCHNDLVCRNILSGERGVWLIDWEYAGTGDPYFDLAVVVQHHDLGDELARILLQAYLGRQAESAHEQRLAAQCRFYRELLNLWNLRLRNR
jgi:thiamine kinase